MTVLFWKQFSAVLLLLVFPWLTFGFVHHHKNKKAWGIRMQEANPQGPSYRVAHDSNHHEKQQRRTLSSFRRFALLKMSSSDDETNNNNPMKIIIAGAPASGKGTQCEIIKEKFGVVHLSTGDMLRAAVADETQVGKQAKSYMDSGQLVPDEVIIGVVKDRLAQSDCKSQGWLLDGFPRTRAQAEALDDAGISADCFLFLNVPNEVLVERVVGRRSDPQTGKIYHLKFSPPPEDIASRLIHRSDDTEEKVKVRLEQFHANVDAVIGSYSDICVEIDGNQAPSKVSEDVAAALDKLRVRAA